MSEDLVEGLGNLTLQVALDVECDVCTGTKRKALKSCLQCRISYCEQHILQHFEVPSKKHRMVEAAKLQENICTKHDEVKSIFCNTDRQFICINCSMSEHKGHEMALPSTAMEFADFLLLQDSKTRAEFSQYADHGSNFQLDENTANTRLLLSQENRKAKNTKVHQPYPDLTDRFMDSSQALCKTGLTGRHYWEVEWSGLGVTVAVAYKEIARRGDASKFGDNDKSWALECQVTSFHTMYKLKHNCDREERFILNYPHKSSKVGVFLDYDAGILSFYIISAQTFTLLYKFRKQFSQPLYAGLGVYYNGSTAEFCDVKRQRVTVDLPQETAAV